MAEFNRYTQMLGLNGKTIVVFLLEMTVLSGIWLV